TLGDDDLDVEVGGERPHPTFLELGPQAAQDVERRVHRAAHVVGRRNVLLPVVPQHTDLHAAQIFAERLAIRGDRPPPAPRVLRVVAGQRLQHQRAVLDGPRQRYAVVERVRVADDARAAY